MDVPKVISAVAASVAALGGSYTLADKFGCFPLYWRSDV